MNQQARSMPMWQKMDLKEGSLAFSLHAPHYYKDFLGPLPKNARFTLMMPPEGWDFLHIFSRDLERLRSELIQLLPGLKKGGTLWLSWPKDEKSMLNENSIQRMAKNLGLTDTDRESIGPDWKGMKLEFL